MRLSVIIFGLILAVTQVPLLAFAQAYVCPQDEQCLSPGLSGIQRQMDLYCIHYSICGGGDAVARSDRGEILGTEAADGCTDCDRRQVRVHKVVRFDGPDANPWDSVLEKNEVDKRVDRGVARFTCPRAGGTSLGTMTLYKLPGQTLFTKLVGSAHSLISEEEVLSLEAQGLDRQAISDHINKIAANCVLRVTNEAGTESLEVLEIKRFHFLTLYTDTNVKKDVLFIEITNPSKYLSPVPIKRTSAKDLVGQTLSMIAYHFDINTEVEKEGRKRVYHPRVKSAGEVMPMHPDNPYSDVSGVILTKIPTNGGSSGALQYDNKGFGVAIHSGGKNDGQLPFNGYSSYNISIIIDDETYKEFEKF